MEGMVPQRRIGMVLLLSGLLAAASCSSRSEEAVRQLEMAERHGASPDEMCRRTRAVAEAYLQEQNEERYVWWNLMANSRCLNAQLAR
jgi:hypothetical protein